MVLHVKNKSVRPWKLNGVPNWLADAAGKRLLFPVHRLRRLLLSDRLLASRAFISHNHLTEPHINRPHVI